MIQTVEALFDGTVLRPDTPLPLEANRNGTSRRPWPPMTIFGRRDFASYCESRSRVFLSREKSLGAWLLQESPNVPQSTTWTP